MNISVCMITKNEQKNLARTLEAIKNFGFEIIIVDTGSTDDTVRIAREYTDKVYFYQWINDFSAARNYAISKAGNDWILSLDADEVVESIDIKTLEKLTTYSEQILGYITIKNHFEASEIKSIYTDTLDRFFNRKAFCFEGTIHEQLTLTHPYPLPKEGAQHDTSIVVEHFGYALSPEELKAKNERNLALLLEELKKDPDNPYVYFQLGQTYNGTDDEKALEYYSKGLEYDLDPALHYVQMMVIAYGYCLVHLNRFEEALELRGVYENFKSSADFLTLMGVIYLRSGMLLPAMGEFFKATMCEISYTEGSNSYVPYYNMGCINELLGDKETARLYYQKCGDFPPAVEKLKEYENNKT